MEPDIHTFQYKMWQHPFSTVHVSMQCNTHTILTLKEVQIATQVVKIQHQILAHLALNLAE